ncbi:hypothetical protein FRB94_004682 [Tulasnella sp. JGI-2019a]|nr:hypothetical protein FRB94_004682 [Tulasnella sp. JGI-2019a]
MSILTELSSGEEHDQVKNLFTDRYKVDKTTGDKVPYVYRIYRIDQTSGLAERYEAYLSRFRGHAYLFHGTTRTCTVGDRGSAKLCYQSDCGLCNIMRNGYDLKYAKGKGLLGAGHYSTVVSSKSTWYSKNEGRAEHSGYKAVMINEASLGNIFETEEGLTRPPSTYQSVYGVGGTQFANDELAVYNNAALRPAYLVICDNLPVKTYNDNPSAVDLDAWRDLARQVSFKDPKVITRATVNGIGSTSGAAIGKYSNQWSEPYKSGVEIYAADVACSIKSSINWVAGQTQQNPSIVA